MVCLGSIPPELPVSWTFVLALEVVDFPTRRFVGVGEKLVDYRDDVTDPFAELVDIEYPSVVQVALGYERQEVVVEREKEPATFRGERELVAIGIAQAALVACGVNLPPASFQSGGYREPDAFVAVNRPAHASA